MNWMWDPKNRSHNALTFANEQVLFTEMEKQFHGEDVEFWTY